MRKVRKRGPSFYILIISLAIADSQQHKRMESIPHAFRGVFSSFYSLSLMLQARSLLPLNPLASQWQLQAILRLPAELRRFTTHDFSERAGESHDRHESTHIHHPSVDQHSWLTQSQSSVRGTARSGSRRARRIQQLRIKAHLIEASPAERRLTSTSTAVNNGGVKDRKADYEPFGDVEAPGCFGEADFLQESQHFLAAASKAEISTAGTEASTQQPLVRTLRSNHSQRGRAVRLRRAEWCIAQYKLLLAEEETGSAANVVHEAMAILKGEAIDCAKHKTSDTFVRAVLSQLEQTLDAFPLPERSKRPFAGEIDATSSQEVGTYSTFLSDFTSPHPTAASGTTNPGETSNLSSINQPSRIDRDTARHTSSLTPRKANSADQRVGAPGQDHASMTQQMIDVTRAIVPIERSQDETPAIVKPSLPVGQSTGSGGIAISQSSELAAIRLQIQVLADLVRQLVFSHPPRARNVSRATQATSVSPDSLPSETGSSAKQMDSTLAALPAIDAATTSRAERRKKGRMQPPRPTTRSEASQSVLPPEEPLGSAGPAPSTSGPQSESEYPQDKIAGAMIQANVKTVVQASDSVQNITIPENTNNGQSLYEQLFPEESARADKRHTTQPKAIPRLPINTDSNTPKQGRRESKSEQLAKIWDAGEEDRRVKHHVLVLRSASKSLRPDDFRRALPRGKHLQSWKQRGQYSKVIPDRDPVTLEKTGDYYIVFRNSFAAETFRKHVKRIHELSKSVAVNSILDPLPPMLNGSEGFTAIEMEQMVRDFSLVPPSMNLHLEKQHEGLPMAVIEKGGYPQILPGKLTPKQPQVLLELTNGPMPNYFQLRDAINQDGRRRNLPWPILAGPFGMRQLNMQRSARLSDGDSEHQVAEDQEGNGEDSTDVDSELVRDVKGKLEKPSHGQRWIVAFTDMEEAVRFARAWGRRKFPWLERPSAQDMYYKGVTTVRTAEVL